jgi:hypothetical protein
VLALGILGEYVLLPFLNEKQFWYKMARIFFAVLVVAGIGGEYWFSSRIAQSAETLQRVSDGEVADANLKAQNATKEAEQAREETATCENRPRTNGWHVSKSKIGWRGAGLVNKTKLCLRAI